VPYASLPFDVPGVSSPLAPGENGQPPDGPLLLRELPEPQRKRSRISPRRRRRPTTETKDGSWLLANLGEDPDQRAAVTHGRGPLMILAGPGSGKTRTLTTRIAYLSESKLAKLQEILAVTFTARAADEMRLRLIDLLGIDRAGSVTVCTLHSLCHRIVRAHAGVFGRDQGYVIADAATLKQIARALIASPPTGELDELLAQARLKDDELLDEALEQIGSAKNQLWTREQYDERSEHPARVAISALWGELDQRLRDANAFSFDDLLVCAGQLLASDSRLRRHYRERYRWMLIDEFQDTNTAQMAVVRALMAPRGNLTVVGDDDQSLYGWRHADSANIINFASQFPGAKTITLERNYRSQSEIVEVSQALISHNKIRAEKTLIAQRGRGERPVTWFFRNDDEEADELAKLIMQDLRLGRTANQIAVLCRNLKPMRKLQQRLQESGIKVRLVGGQSLWERSEIRDAIGYLAVLANPYDANAFRRAVTAPRDRKPFTYGKVKAPSRGIDVKLEEITAYAEAHQLDLIDATLHADEIEGLPPRSVAPLREFAAALDRIRRQAWNAGAGCPSVGSLVSQVLRMPGGPIETYSMLRDQARNRGVRQDATRVLHDLHSLTRAAQNWEETTSEPLPAIAGFLESLAIDPDHEVDSATDDRVTLSTIHSAKGLEFEVVVVLGVEEGLLPDHRSAHDPVRLEEERRLFYVATTRAVVNLLITHVASRDGAPTGGPSRFLAEANLI
jgi:DNA helicase II / ATP-dependent DNA helicase PcrA